MPPRVPALTFKGNQRQPKNWSSSCSSIPPPPSPLVLEDLSPSLSLSLSDAPEGHVSSVEVQ
jgi:hypothetical protein